MLGWYKRKSSSPVMGPFMEIVDTWLEKDQLLPCKQRHTGIRIFQRLQAEHDFSGGQRTVLAYVKRRKSEMEIERAKTYERLEHPPGEAQVDFTTIQVSQHQQLLTYKLLIMSFPYSCSLCLSDTGRKPGVLSRGNEANL